MTALDTSVCVPSLVGWHEHHEPCRLAAAGGLVPGHVLLETYSVLTRLPAPHRLQAQLAGRLLSARFRPEDVLVASPSSGSRVGRPTTAWWRSPRLSTATRS